MYDSKWSVTTEDEDNIERERERERELGGKAGFSKPLQTLSELNYCTCWALKTTSHRDGHTTQEADVNLKCTLGLLKDAC